ncbi:hypothetical protein MLD38_004155 [Melastoma candidum]|nr:hypothetical protein MLD38_004155 [Melastoma candidum]
MVLKGVQPDSVTISSILPVLVELERFSTAREVHGFIIRKNLDSDVFIANSLIDMYAKSEQPVKASVVFRRTDRKNVVSWNAMVANYAQNGLEVESVSLIREMQTHGLHPTSVTFTNVLPACARIGLIRHGKEIHAKSIRFGLISDLLLSNSLVDMYVKCDRFKLARCLFAISEKDEVSYNILIVGYSQTSNCLESLGLFSEMQIMGLKFEIVSFMGVVSACANLAAIKQGKEIHGLLIRRHLHSHLFIANSLLDLYTKCGQIHVSKRIFDRMPARDVASWNTIIMGYGMLGQSDFAINLFEGMRLGGSEPDAVSYIAVLSACAHGGLVELGMKYFNDMQSLNIHPTMMHYACVVDLLGRAALLKEAMKFIEGLPTVPDSNIWGALLSACRQHGHIELGCWAADRLLELRPQHSGYYALLSNMYAEAGRWKEANKIRGLMKSRGVAKNPGFSWVQMQNKIHAFVVGEKVEDMDAVWLAESS